MRKPTMEELEDFQRRRAIALKWLSDTLRRLNKLEYRLNQATQLEDVREAVTVISDEAPSNNIHDMIDRAEKSLPQP